MFTELFEASGGIPRRVNQIANRLLLLGAVEERGRIDAAMLQSVLDEMDSERAFPAAAPKPMVNPEPQDYHAAPVSAPAPAPMFDPQVVEDMLAERDAQIAELQQAVVELAEQQDQAVASAMQPEIQALQEKIARLDARTFEQERTIRHTLTMLIEWIEGEMDESKAA